MPSKKVKLQHATWVEINKQAYRHNLRIFRKLAKKHVKLLVVVKANAYGHGLKEISCLAEEAGVDFLGVNALFEAEALRQAGIKLPILILGYVPEEDVRIAVRNGFHLTVYTPETIEASKKAAKRLNKTAWLHLKVETGTYRQGVHLEDIGHYAEMVAGVKHVRIAGLSTHFANIEDTTDHSFAEYQLRNYLAALEECKRQGLKLRYRHTACTAATLLFPRTYFDMVRVGIGSYGLWPSKQTYLSSVLEGKPGPALKPVLSWKTRIAQLKTVAPDTFMGYGCTYRTTHETKMAVLPVGYYDGYDRRLSNIGYVLIRGKRAPVRGRVCMNMIMVDVTHIPDVSLRDEAVLLGNGDSDRISAEDLASLCHTINYEIVSRIALDIPRVVV